MDGASGLVVELVVWMCHGVLSAGFADHGTRLPTKGGGWLGHEIVDVHLGIDGSFETVLKLTIKY